MNDLSDVLRFLGYDEVRTAGGGEWTPVDEINGRLDGANTGDVHVMIYGRWSPSCRLRDGETGERVAVARDAKTE